MPTPFPGMDPYLEKPGRWPNIHARLIVALADDITAKVRPRYYVSVEEHAYLLRLEEMERLLRPDISVVRENAPVYEAAAEATLASPVDKAARASTQAVAKPVTITLPVVEEVHERFLEVRQVEDGRLVTVIEILSPTNKQSGKGRALYAHKRQAVLESQAHLVEIDLLRAGEPPEFIHAQQLAHYYILLSQEAQRPSATLIPWHIRHPIPTFRLPLLPGDDEPEVDLGQILHALYARAGFDLRIDYKQEPDPPFSGEDKIWVDTLLKNAGLR